ncbi:MAG: PH domain-containing protein [Vicinamibacterales bacterium]
MQEFLIAPAAGRSLWLLLLVPGLVLALVVGLLGAAFRGARSARFEVSPAGLRLRGDLYGRLIPAARLEGASIARVDLATRQELAPRRRTLGTGLPGYNAGWFRLGNGEKALLYLTDTSRAVYMRTMDGYSVLVSPAEPDRFVAALRAVADARQW